MQGACRCPAGKALACTAESCDDGGSHHDRLSLVLDDVARPSHFVSSAQAGEEELVARVDGLVRGVHGVVPTGRLGVCTFRLLAGELADSNWRLGTRKDFKVDSVSVLPAASDRNLVEVGNEHTPPLSQAPMAGTHIELLLYEKHHSLLS